MNLTRTAVAVFLLGWLVAPSVLRSDCSLASVGIAPLNDAGPHFYQNFQAGLYPRGGNSRPPAVETAAFALANQIQPLDTSGVPNGNGKIVLLSIGLSNTTQEFASAGTGAFKPRADADPAKNPRLTIVDGAQGGQDAAVWADPSNPVWTTADTRLTNSGATPAQVQAVWLKHARATPNNLGTFPLHAQVLRDNLEALARNLHQRYPNLKLVYFSSRTRAYTNVVNGLNPEPFAFEGGFSCKWAIEDQIAGRNNLNWDPARGPVVAPLLLWGPYLWADGTNPRSDGFTWLCSDLKTDFTHPSVDGGVPKVGTQLLAFFKTDATTAPWFLKSTVTGQPPTVDASADVTNGNAPLAVNFTAAASDPDGTISSYEWTFSDGTFSTAQNPAKTFPAPGSYNAYLTVADNSGNAVRRSIPITVNLTLAEWRSIYFTAAERLDPAISGDLADPDVDGLTNLAEYKLGTNPKTPDAGLVTAQVIAGHLAISFPRAKFANEATITVEAADDPLGPWSSGPSVTAEQTTGDDGIVETVVATDLATGASPRFTRLRIDRLASRASKTK